MKEMQRKPGAYTFPAKSIERRDTSGNRNPERKRREKRISEILSKSSEERKGYP
jgi:hypothetical protein